MHSIFAHRLDRSPGGVVSYRRGELLIDGDDYVWIPDQNLLNRNIGEAAGRFSCNIAADQFDGLDVDRAAEPGCEPLLPARVIDPRPLIRGNRLHAGQNRLERIFSVARKLLGILGATDQLAERTVGLGNPGEAAIQQRIGNAGLLLYAVRERNEGGAGRSDVENEIGFEREYRFQIGGVAASGDAADFGPRANLGKHVGTLFRPIGARPSDQQIRCQRVKQDRRRRSGGKHARYLCRNGHGTPRSIAHGLRGCVARRDQRLRQTRDQGAAVDQSTPTITSLALITAVAVLPLASLSSSTASLVIEAVTMTPPPISIRIWDVVAPFTTSTMVPLS